MTYVIQNVSLRREAFSKGEAIAWVREHNYHPLKPVHVTPEFYQFRLVDPERIRGARFRTIDLGRVGHLIVAYL
jgi:hypothetical protein